MKGALGEGEQQAQRPKGEEGLPGLRSQEHQGWVDRGGEQQEGENGEVMDHINIVRFRVL